MILKIHSSFGPPKRKGDEKTAEIKPTLLECRNAQVDRANSAEMSKLNGDARVFDARDRAASKTYESQLKHCSAPEKLELKVGAQVILLKNLDPENGELQ
jgi:ATP-dependent DNA helicase PIF1